MTTKRGGARLSEVKAKTFQKRVILGELGRWLMLALVTLMAMEPPM